MNNSVYLLSQNMKLMKCFLNCDFIADIFKLEGLSTNVCNFDLSEIKQHNNAILIIDTDKVDVSHFYLIKEIKKLQKYRNVKLIYACPNVNKTITLEINNLSDSAVFNKNLDFMTFLNWIQNEDKEENEKFHIEKEIKKQLKCIGISASVLGFTYLKEAVFMKIQQSKIKLVEICDKIAREHQTTSSRVERCMRTALKNADENNFAYLGLSVSKVSCKDFIVYLSDYILNNKE